MKELLMRTFLFVPGHIDRMIEKSIDVEADCIAFCLEDAVPYSKKEEARQKVKKILDSKGLENKNVFVRINSMDTGLTLLDVNAVVSNRLDGFVYPMANTADDIKNFSAQLKLIESQNGFEVGKFSIVVLIETPQAVINAYEIAKSSDRVVALLFGCEDYMASMESRYSDNEMSLFVPRSNMAIAAKAAGVESIDTPYVNMNDFDGLKRFANVGRDLGMSGMLVMSPNQLEIIKECYTPSEEEVRVASEIVNGEKLALSEGRGIVVINGNFVSPPTIKQAKKLLRRAKLIKG
jgi:citrate lyase subunit beta/citryl-CoA lyase